MSSQLVIERSLLLLKVADVRSRAILMSILPTFLRSLMLTILLSFVAPIFLFGGVLVSLSLIGYIPGIERVAQVIAEQILQFLATFGRRNPFQGLVVIALTCSLVGALFDTYAFYRHQSLRNH